MTKKQHIEYWTMNAERDWERAKHCYKTKDYVFCLFCLHLSLEKICKALWVKHNETNYPPKIHNLEKILRYTPIELNEEDWKFLINLNMFQLEGRYPDYRDKIYKICTKDFTKEIFDEAKKMKICLTEKLQ